MRSLFINFFKLQKAFKVSEKLPYTLLQYTVESNQDFWKKQQFFWLDTNTDILDILDQCQSTILPSFFPIGLCIFSYQLIQYVMVYC